MDWQPVGTIGRIIFICLSLFCCSFGSPYPLIQDNYLGSISAIRLCMLFWLNKEPQLIRAMMVSVLLGALLMSGILFAEFVLKAKKRGD